MSVEYNGRARSVLYPGNYAVIYKRDGSIQIHGGDLIKPRNFIGPRGQLTITDNEIISKRGKEEIRITVTSVKQLLLLDYWSIDKIQLSRTEAELVSKIVSNPVKYFGFAPGHVYREYRTTVGPIDILACTKPVTDLDNTIYVVEVKRGKATINSANQLRKYMQAMPHSRVLGILAAPAIAKSAVDYCSEYGIEYIAVDFD